MIFSSIFFIFAFLPIVLVIYYLVPFAGKNLVLLISSLIFYAWGEPVYVILMLLSIGINYVSGMELEYELEAGHFDKAKYACIVTAVINFLILGFYKYYGFLIENLNAVLPFDIPYKELALPIGISFYTFQTMSYVIDVYRGKVKAQHDLIAFGAYVSMFPQLIAGPIVRYSDVERQLRKRTISFERFGEGAVWFLRGLGKKVLIANNIGSIYESVAALGVSEMSALSAWIGCFAYTMQIYFDFGGYSDMAIGLGKMLGFDFMKNFDYPYISKSITEFWRRWHISLSSWFKEYVYIPLGGNRGGTLKAIRNLMVVLCVLFLLMGIMFDRGMMLLALLMAGMYFLYEAYSVKDYEYVMEGTTFTVTVIHAKRRRREEHELDLKNLEVVAPNWHEAVAKYRLNGGTEKLPKYDYTSYEPDVPYYTMIIMENRKKIKLLLDLEEDMLQAMKRINPQKVFVQN